MNKQPLTTILFSIVILFSFSTMMTYADHSAATILNPEGSSVPGCEETNECFIPSIVTIPTGGEVVWKNVDNAAHTVTSGANYTPDGIFDSGLFTPDTEFSHIFDTPGQYPYFCLIHPWQTGLVIVGDSMTLEERVTALEDITRKHNDLITELQTLVTTIMEIINNILEAMKQ